MKDGIPSALGVTSGAVGQEPVVLSMAIIKACVLPRLPVSAGNWWLRIESSPVGTRLARGAFWSLAGAIVSRGLALLASVLVARILGKAGFGQLGVVQGTMGMFGVLAGFGLGLTSTKFVAEYRTRSPARAGRVIALSARAAWVTGSTAAVGLWMAAPWLAEHTLAAPQLAHALRVSALLVLLGGVNGAQTGALSGFESFRTIAAINLAGGLASFPLLVLGAEFWGLDGAVWGLVVSLGVNTLLGNVALRKQSAQAKVPLLGQGCWAEWDVLWHFTLPAFLCGTMGAPVFWACSAMLVNRPNGYGEMGILNAANQWLNAVMFLPAILGQAVLPILVEQRAHSRNSGKILAAAMALNAAAAFPVVLVICLCSPFIMRVYGPDFRGAWPVLVVVSLTGVLQAIQTAMGQIITAAGRLWMGLAMSLGWGLALLGIAWVALDLGALGLAAAGLGAYFLHAAWTSLFAYRIVTLDTPSQLGIKQDRAEPATAA